MTYAVNKQGSWLSLAVVLLIAQRTDQCDLCVIIISILAMRDQQINSKRVGWGAVAMKTSHRTLVTTSLRGGVLRLTFSPFSVDR